MLALRLRERLPSRLRQSEDVRQGESRRRPQEFVREKELGSDPLDVDADSFLERFEGRKGGVRAALMNQQVLTSRSWPA
jgi:hypothetical protein